MNGELEEKDIKEQLLDLTLDDVENRMDLLEWGVPEFLKKSNSKPRRHYNPNEELTDDQLVLQRNEDVWSRRVSQSYPVPEIVLSGRSRFHFEGPVGKIYAYNLAFEVTDDDLKTLFGAFGPLKRAAINYDRNGRSCGTGFIVFEKRADAQMAFRQLDGHQLDGRKLFLRLLDSQGMRGEDKRQIRKVRGDEKPIDDETVLEDREKITVEDLDGLDLDNYVRRRKKAKTWNYY